MKQAMIFAAGMGTRLKPITDSMPKALVSVAGKPLLCHAIEKMKAAGFTDIVINVHHFADMIEDYLRENNNFGINIQTSDERKQLLETGGGLKKARTLLTSHSSLHTLIHTLIHNVDILSNVDLSKFYAESEKYDATLLVSERDTQRYLIFDEDMRLVGWTNIKTGEVKSPYPAVHQAFEKDYVATEVPYNFIDFNHRPQLYSLYAFAGIHTISTSLMKEMDSWPEKFSIIDFYLSLCQQYDIRGYLKPDLKLLDVGKLDTLEEAESFLGKL